MLDILIYNTTIIDGSGAAPFRGSVGVENGSLRILTADTEKEAKTLIDGSLLHTCPGFIDPHSHGDVPLGRDYASLSKISQGITTHVTGMCGFSMFPVNKDYLDLLKEGLDIFTDVFPPEMETFTTCKAYLDYSDTVKRPENTRFLMGHVSLRTAVMGFANRRPSTEELNKMKEIMTEAMENGAAGLSSGLVYIPSVYAEAEELTALCQVVAKYGGVYTTHMRNESSHCLESVEESIEIARKTGVRVIISHLKVAGQNCDGLAEKILTAIDDANKEGLDISCDQYPYAASMTHLSVCIPPNYFTNGLSGMVEYLKVEKTRALIRQEMEDPKTPYDNFYLNSGGFKGIFIIHSAALPEAEGCTILEFAEKTNQEPFDAFCQILIENGGIASAIYFALHEEDLFRIIKNDNVVVGTDGIVKSANERAHPRAYGTFPRAIRYYVKDKNILTLEKMIWKMTGLTAEKTKIANKGLLKDAYDADIVLMNYDTISDTADFMHTNLLADGIETVIVGGEIVYKDKQLTGKTPGKTLRFHS